MAPVLMKKRLMSVRDQAAAPAGARRAVLRSNSRMSFAGDTGRPSLRVTKQHVVRMPASSTRSQTLGSSVIQPRVSPTECVGHRVSSRLPARNLSKFATAAGRRVAPLAT